MNIQIAILVLGDLVLAVSAVYSGYFARLSYLYSFNAARLSVIVLAVLFFSFLMELYNFENSKGKKELLLRVCIANIISFFTLSAVYYMIPTLMFGRGILVITLILFTACQFLWHLGFSILFHSRAFAKRVLILGTGLLARKMGTIIASTNHQHVLAGFVSCSTESVCVPSDGIVGNGSGILETVSNERAHKIVVSLTENRGIMPLKEILSCKLSGIDVMDAPSFYEDLTRKLLIEEIRPSWLIFSDGFKVTHVKRVSKRAFDIILSIIGLIFVLPLIPAIALLIRIDSSGNIVLKQVRVGEKERQFVLYKFRTMHRHAEKKTGPVWSQKNDNRITRVGKILRKTRLDEIPQVFNVLRGDMSFIGPRPERPEFVEKLKDIVPYYSERHFVKPGITGWAQVRYPYGANVDDALEKLRYDLYYIKHLSLFFDLLILLETIKVVIFGRGGR